ACPPTKRFHGLLGGLIRFRCPLIVRHGYRALLCEECLRRTAANLVSGFRIGSSACRKRICATRNACVACSKFCQTLCAYISSRAVADAIRSCKDGVCGGELAVCVVPERGRALK